MTEQGHPNMSLCVVRVGVCVCVCVCVCAQLGPNCWVRELFSWRTGRVDSWLSVGAQLALSWLYSWLSVGSAVFSRFRNLHKNNQIYVIIKGGAVVPNSMFLCKNREPTESQL